MNGAKRRPILLLLALGVATGCAAATGGGGPGTRPGPPAAVAVNCGPNAAASADIVLPPTGGTITAGDATLEVPPGAVTGPTRFHLVVPAGRQFLVRASAMTANGSAVDEFNAPLTLTLHYGQHGCPRHPTTGSPKEYYSIWEVGTDGKPAKPLGGADITGKAEIQGLVGHFSGFILAQG